jgi:hypothetical protein
MRASTKNKKPEKLAQAQILNWCLQNGWIVNSYDSKGSFSPTAGRYTKNPGLPVGQTDVMGCDQHGNICLLEIKTDKTENVVRWAQYLFMRRFIHVAFVAVVSNPEDLAEAHKEWLYSGSQEGMIARLPTKALMETKVGGKKVKQIVPIQWV